MDDVTKLALDISSCCEVSKALTDLNHPCHKVVDWQAKEWSPQVLQIENSRMHRPEAWTGDLSIARIVFLASNPSFNLDESFPNWSNMWSQDQIVDFAKRRFIREGERFFGAIDSGPNRDKTYLESKELSENSVAYWREIRGRVAELLGKDVSEVSAHEDFVMTELVHCKSFKEIGVNESLGKCSSKFLHRIFELSQASHIVVMGKKPAQQLIKLFPEIPNTWGFWKLDDGSTRGFWPKSTEISAAIKDGRWSPSEQRKHTVELSIGGKTRQVIWLPRPNSSYPRTLAEPLISTDLLTYWRSSLK
jgi:hypothetical protein